MDDHATARALGEVTSALEHVVGSVSSLEQKIDSVARDGRAESARAVEKISELALEVRTVTERLAAHERSDAENFERLENVIEDHATDRGRLWRAVAGMSSAGGFGAFLGNWFQGGGSG